MSIRSSELTRTDTIETSASAFRILSDPTRLSILKLIVDEPGICVNEIADEINRTHSAVSHQLAKLEAQGVVERTRDGQTMCYTVRQGTLTQKLIKALNLFIR